MGFENSLRTITEKEIIKAWIIGLSLQSNGSPQKQELSDDDNGSAAAQLQEERIIPRIVKLLALQDSTG